MNKEQIKLEDSVLKLKVGDETLNSFAKYQIFTISDLLKEIAVLREEKEIYNDAMSALEKAGLKPDSKLSYSKLCERDEQRQEKLKNQMDILS